MEVDDLSLYRTKFSAAEDELLRKTVQKFGPRKWNSIAKHIPGRTARQCRDRFQNYLSPDLINGPWTQEEDQLLIQKVNEFGPYWSKINKFFVGRSPNNIKNRYNTHLIKIKNQTKKHQKKLVTKVQPVETHEGTEFHAEDVLTSKIWDEINTQDFFSPNFELLWFE